MTQLPKHLEEMRDELAEKNADIFYHAQGDIHQTMPWSDCKESYQNGFNQAASIMLKDMEEMAKALEDAATLDYGFLPKAKEALKIWREKYKPEGL